MAIKQLIFSAALALSLAGCQKSLYDWGCYEDSVWTIYAPASTDQTTVGNQIQTLEKEIQLTRSSEKPDEVSRVPPGKYAHLGYLYAMQGDKDSAVRCFNSEKQLYPESTRFVDGMVSRLNK